MATVRKTATPPSQKNAQVDSQIERIRSALIEAENSGEPQRFDPETFKQRMQSERG